MKVAILFDEIKPQDILDDKDVMQQVSVVVNALKNLGHEYRLIPCTLDLMELKSSIMGYEPDVTFNLLDTLDSQDCLSHLPIALLDSMHIKHTGPDAIDLSVATRKLLAKQRLLDRKIPTPDCIFEKNLPYTIKGSVGVRYIIKAANEDGSFGMNDSSVTDNPSGSMIEFRKKTGREPFAEQYIEGREFTVPFLGMECLPPVEVTYSDYPDGKPKILAQAAKWQPESFESKHTGTKLLFGEEDSDLLYCMNKLTERCISLFNMHGWGRIDFRVSKSTAIMPEVPYVIDVNANSCLAPDAWWQESLAHAGYTIESAIEIIMQDTP